MTRAQRLELLKQIEKDIYVCSLESTFLEDAKSCAIHSAIEELEQESVLDKIRAEIENCLKALDEIEKSGLNIYPPNEISGRRLTYQQCLEFIDKYKAESDDQA